ncbi:MAG: hypothetical protein OXE83_03330 [Gammaproteobacteria bacterium]|nr:hypothetical protein [Gammaproteobacteria bacterium]
MDIATNEFRYFFRLTGESGGLSSIDVEFKPVRTKWRSSDHMKAAARYCIDAYTEGLAEVKMEDDARAAMDRLEQTLQTTQERENADYYERLSKSGTV